MERQLNGQQTRPFLRVLVVLMAAVFGGVAGAAGGWLLGALFGGNYAVNFQFAGLRGYEATGQIGAILGFLLVGLFCASITGRVLARR